MEKCKRGIEERKGQRAKAKSLHGNLPASLEMDAAMVGGRGGHKAWEEMKKETVVFVGR